MSGISSNKLKAKAKIRNAFANNVSTGIKLSKVQLFKIIQLGRFLSALYGNLAGALTKVVVPLIKNVLTPLVTTALAAAIDGAGIVKAGKGITLAIMNGDMDFIRTIKSPKKSEILTHRVSATVKYETKKQCVFFDMLLELLGASILGNILTGKGAVRAGREYNMDLLEQEQNIIIWIICIKKFSSALYFT